MALAVLDISKAAELAHASLNSDADPDAALLLSLLRDRKLALEANMARFTMLCDRWDNLFYPQGFTAGGASHWSNHSSAHLPGRSHVSVNSYASIVEIGAALQSVLPVENFVPTDDKEGSAALAAATERLYMAWKEDEKFELKVHQACVVKGLYGVTAGKVVFDADLDRPTLEIIDNPRNLWLGWRDSNYQALEWCLYTYRITPATAMEDWGLEVHQGRDENGKTYPFVAYPTGTFSLASMVQTDMEVEVYDYWYRRPKEGAKLRFGQPTKFETWNAIYIGNVLVKNKRHAEYKGKMPYVPLFNGYIPGLPEGKSDFYEVEQLIREKDERISENAQMMSRAVNGQYWQLTGAEAPEVVPVGLKPVPNGVVAPGAGNRLEALAPWMPEFQMEQYLGRLDREITDITGQNELIRGQAPAQVLSSGKAIQALVANFETRIMLKRAMLYDWRLELWNLVTMVWGTKNAELRDALSGSSKLEVEAPNLTPRDDAEASTIAANMKQAKIWSAIRAMDRMGVKDPERELDVIRGEQTDATLNPAEVQVMAQLLAVLKSQGIQPEAGLQSAVQSQAGSLNDVRQLNPGPAGTPGQNDPNAQQGPPPAGLPSNAPGSLDGAPVAPGGESVPGAGALPPGGPPGPPGAPGAPGAPVPGAPTVGPEDLTLQTAIKGGQAQSRILQQSRITTQAQQRGG